MQMTNTELAALVNSRLGLTGSESVTTNVIRQWVDWDVLPKARIQGREQSKGPVWSRPGADVRRALRLGELRRRGIKREKALIVQAYIEWGHPDLGRVRDALLDDWSKWAAQLTRGQTTYLNEAKYRDISTTKKRAIATQLGPLDVRFVGTQFQQSHELYAVINEFARGGGGSSKVVQALISAALDQILPGIVKIVPADFIEMLTGSFAGLIGASDEIDNSGASTIQKATERQFRIARLQIRLLFRFSRKFDLLRKSASLDPNVRKLLEVWATFAPQILTGPWIILLFVQSVKIAAMELEN